MAANKLRALYLPTDGFDVIFDDDRLSLDEEILHGTDPTVNDTDGDGLDDGAEVLDWNSCPWKKDSDGDGMIDGSDSRPLFPDGCAWFVGQPDTPYEPENGTYAMVMLPLLPPKDHWVERPDKPRFKEYPYGTLRVRYEYDTAGNVTTCHVGDVKTVFRYNAQNKLSLVNYNNAAVYEFLYDSENHRVAIRKDSGNWRYDLHDGNICIASVVDGTIDRFFVRGAGVAEGTGDVLVEIENPISSPVLHYYVPNHRGDTVLTLDSGGTVESWYRYDAFGNARRGYGSFAPRYTFSTKEYLPEPNLYLYAYRVYDPMSGRWTQRDPIGYQDSVNLYAFCGNNPVQNTDGLGLAVNDVERVEHDTSREQSSQEEAQTSSAGPNVVGNRSQPPKNWADPGKGWKWSKQHDAYKKGQRIRRYSEEHRGPHWDESDPDGNNHENVPADQPSGEAGENAAKYVTIGAGAAVTIVVADKVAGVVLTLFPPTAPAGVVILLTPP